jgi:hypothetical protein
MAIPRRRGAEEKGGWGNRKSHVGSSSAVPLASMFRGRSVRCMEKHEEKKEIFRNAVSSRQNAILSYNPTSGV